MLCTRLLATMNNVSNMGRLKSTCHVATCLNGEPPWKSDIGPLWVVCHGNDSTHGHQVGAVGQRMGPACCTGGHVADMRLHVPVATAAGQILWSNILILSNARVWGNRRQAVCFEDKSQSENGFRLRMDYPKKLLSWIFEILRIKWIPKVSET